MLVYQGNVGCFSDVLDVLKTILDYVWYWFVLKKRFQGYFSRFVKGFKFAFCGKLGYVLNTLEI